MFSLIYKTYDRKHLNMALVLHIKAFCFKYPCSYSKVSENHDQVFCLKIYVIILKVSLALAKKIFTKIIVIFKKLK